MKIATTINLSIIVFVKRSDCSDCPEVSDSNVVVTGDKAPNVRHVNRHKSSYQ